MSTLLSEENGFHTQGADSTSGHRCPFRHQFGAVSLIIIFSGNNAVHWILSPLKQRCSCLISTLSFFWGHRAQCFAVPGCGPRCKTASMLLSGCIDFRRPRGPIASPWPRLRKAGRDERERRKKKGRPRRSANVTITKNVRK